MHGRSWTSIITIYKKGVDAKWVPLQSGVRTTSTATIVSFSKKPYPYCLVLVGFRNRIKRELTIELPQIEDIDVKKIPR